MFDFTSPNLTGDVGVATANAKAAVEALKEVVVAARAPVKWALVIVGAWVAYKITVGLHHEFWPSTIKHEMRHVGDTGAGPAAPRPSATGS